MSGVDVVALMLQVSMLLLRLGGNCGGLVCTVEFVSLFCLLFFFFSCPICWLLTNLELGVCACR